MAAVRIPTPDLVEPTNGVRSTYAQLDHNGVLQNEELFLRYATSWRGEAVEVTVQARRYRHSEGLGEWRWYAQRAVKTGAYGTVSDTARSRLGEACNPLVEQFLASPAAAEAHENGVYRDLRRQLTTLHGHNDVEPYLAAVRGQVGAVRLSSARLKALADGAHAALAYFEACDRAAEL